MGKDSWFPQPEPRLTTMDTNHDNGIYTEEVGGMLLVWLYQYESDGTASDPFCRIGRRWYGSSCEWAGVLTVPYLLHLLFLPNEAHGPHNVHIV